MLIKNNGQSFLVPIDLAGFVEDIVREKPDKFASKSHLFRVALYNLLKSEGYIK